MSIRFQKRVKVLPFLWLNFSKTNFSVTIGGKFLKLNIGRKGIWFTGSLAGSGISYRKKLNKKQTQKSPNE
ncbi:MULTISPECIES: DUF4236 domain-containing protein [Pseudoalteromonas]|uniref:DUF4236 domain-containing protein n=1 Tax=Pseudoalteromonas TaxID=53246 RepID=UPI00110B252F|nr:MULTISPECIES: DUF4236 domain-containing protein [Pseudoalteromonas]MCG7545396.1 DUF4236 domain-containing protein [Pseudoalteromonas sp. MM17-2]TMO87673.1 DUF4236 domain-containing protein [Pseudoalteromonas ruthenica]TMP22250.1 DUF4236 domain-containing protein [Pseudoalteromonas ruthenica]